MSSKTRPTAILVIASILIGCGVLTFVSYKTLDALHIGTNESDNCTLNLKADSWVNASYAPASTPTYMQKKANGAYNGTAPITAGKITWPNTDHGQWQQPYMGIYVDYVAGPLKDGASGAVRNDTKYLQVNYTTRGAEIRTVIGPTIILCSVMAIVFSAAYMMGYMGGFGGSGGGHGHGRRHGRRGRHHKTTKPVP
jgi:hypothetical protein